MRLRVWITLAVALLITASAAWAVVPGYPLKWSQPIYRIGSDAAGVPIYWGWDQPSYIAPTGGGPQVADDWLCKDKLPVTDFHWWGSYLGWRENAPPPGKVGGFWFGIYTDVPVSPDTPFSHPGQLLWQYSTNQYQETFVGWDVIQPGTAPIEGTFQYNVYLPREKWFYQPGDNQILWLSIRAIAPVNEPFTEWGWKTRPHYFQDDAVYGVPGAGWQPIYGPDGLSWDMAFEISTVPEPGSVVMLASGLIGLVGFMKRRRR